jgi:hypothetical protein
LREFAFVFDPIKWMETLLSCQFSNFDGLAQILERRVSVYDPSC